VGGLELAQLAQQAVVLRVRDLRPVFEVVEAVVAGQRLEQQLDPPADGCERVSGQASVSTGNFR
jgi:hypothetical protein